MGRGAELCIFEGENFAPLPLYSSINWRSVGRLEKTLGSMDALEGLE